MLNVIEWLRDGVDDALGVGRQGFQEIPDNGGTQPDGLDTILRDVVAMTRTLHADLIESQRLQS